MLLRGWPPGSGEFLKKYIFIFFFSAEESSVYGSHTAGSLTKKGRKNIAKQMNETTGGDTSWSEPNDFRRLHLKS